MKVKVVNNSKHPLPEYMTSGSVGMDLRALIDSSATKVIADGFIQVGYGEPDKLVLEPMGRAVIDTGIQIQLPEGETPEDGIEAEIRGRSGLALKHGIWVSIGTIDSDYRGRIGAIIINLSKEKFVINEGDRIAQVVFKKVAKIEWEEVKELDKTERGEGGYGHTGMK